MRDDGSGSDGALPVKPHALTPAPLPPGRGDALQQPPGMTPSAVITGLVPVIPIMGSTALFRSRRAGTDPRITSGDGQDGEGVIPGGPKDREGDPWR